MELPPQLRDAGPREPEPPGDSARGRSAGQLQRDPAVPPREPPQPGRKIDPKGRLVRHGRPTVLDEDLRPGLPAGVVPLSVLMKQREGGL